MTTLPLKESAEERIALHRARAHPDFRYMEPGDLYELADEIGLNIDGNAAAVVGAFTHGMSTPISPGMKMLAGEVGTIPRRKIGRLE